MDTKPTVLIVGVTGALGAKIAHAILDNESMNVRALVRSGSQNKPTVAGLVDRGVSIVEGDLFDLPSLQKACEGTISVISTVKGTFDETSEREIILDGQLNLIQAAESTGVQRFIPSDFSVNYFNVEPEDNYNLNLRIQIAEALKQSKLKPTFVLNGVFTEVLLSPFLKVIDLKAGVFRYWGDGVTLFDTTTYDDTAKYVAEAIADSDLTDRPLQIAGDVLTLKQLHATYESVTGQTLMLERMGSIEELKQQIEAKKQTATSHFEYLADQYQYVTFSGKGKLDHLDNDRYPHIKPATVKQFLTKTDCGTLQPTPFETRNA